MMVLIRQGKMKDCTDLFEVYQGTRWFYRTREGGYTTVEQIKEEHRGAAFSRWGWLVAEEKGKVIGEIVFRDEKNPVAGKIGIIRNLDIDVRYQKAAVGTKLTLAAETAMKEKRIVRVIATTPPAAYNYWMKVKYFARGSISNLKLSLSKVPEMKTPKVKTVKLKNPTNLPKSMKFSNTAYPGSLTEMAGDVIDGRLKGSLFEFTSDSRIIGVGVIVRKDAKTASFVADVTKKGLDQAALVISRTARAAVPWKVKYVETTIPKDQIGLYTSFAKWSSELSTDIPVTKLL
ncbi:GNAT family N-acetyltransferase [Candidatus Thorarchaeota archaeon]|nr:MAG: GNAT family N-acetyltransferase [Candidatus Thorarchaeota archaeon]